MSQQSETLSAWLTWLVKVASSMSDHFLTLTKDGRRKQEYTGKVLHVIPGSEVKESPFLQAESECWEGVTFPEIHLISELKDSKNIPNMTSEAPTLN